MRRVLVTGADGFLGRHLVAALLARGDAAVGLDLAFAPGFPDAAERRRATVTDRGAMRAAAEGCDAVIHAAAIADLWAERPGAHDAINREGTEIALDAAWAAGARFVLVSSYTTLVAADCPHGAWLTEGEVHPPDRLTGPYPASKRAAEIAVERAAEAGTHALSVLPSAPVGPGDASPTPPGRLLLDLARGRVPALMDSVIDLVDVRALAGGILAALDHGRPGRRYLLSGESVGLHDLAARVAALTARRPATGRVPARLALAFARAEETVATYVRRAPSAPLTGVRLAAIAPRFDPRLARRALGWAPPGIDDALAEALLWYAAEDRLRLRPKAPLHARLYPVAAQPRSA